MRGATAPRLQLELICARVLLPAADHEERGLAARLDRLERRLAAGTVGGTPDSARSAAPAPTAARKRPAAEPAPTAAAPTAAPTSPPAPATAPAPAAAARPPPSPQRHRPRPPPRRSRVEPAAAEPAAAGQPAPDCGAGGRAGGSPGTGGVDLITVRRMWPDVLDVVKGMRRFTWTLLSHNAQVAGVENGRLTLSMVNAGARDSFISSGSDEIVRQALITVLAVDWKVDAVVDPDHRPGAAGRPAADAAAARRAAPAGADRVAPAAIGSGRRRRPGAPGRRRARPPRTPPRPTTRTPTRPA